MASETVSQPKTKPCPSNAAATTAANTHPPSRHYPPLQPPNARIATQPPTPHWFLPTRRWAAISATLSSFSLSAYTPPPHPPASFSRIVPQPVFDQRDQLVQLSCLSCLPGERPPHLHFLAPKEKFAVGLFPWFPAHTGGCRRCTAARQATSVALRLSRCCAAVGALARGVGAANIFLISCALLGNETANMSEDTRRQIWSGAFAKVASAAPSYQEHPPWGSTPRPQG